MLKRWLILTSLGVLSACAGTTFHSGDCTTGNKDCRQKDIGLYYYQPVPHLLVTRPQNKDGATSTAIVYLPDTEKPMSMKFHSGFGKGVMAVTLTNGMVTSFNQETDPKVAELLGSITAPVTGLATAEATRATGALTRAQAAEIMGKAAAATPAASEFVSLQNNNKLFESDVSLEAWRCRVSPAVSEANPFLSDAQIDTIQKAAGKLACAVVQLRKLGDGTQVDEFVRLIEGLDGLTTARFASGNDARLIRLLHKGSLEASVIKASIVPYKDYNPGEGDAQKTIKGFVLEAVTLLLGVADELSPPDTSPPAEPFELYKINMADGKLERVKK